MRREARMAPGEKLSGQLLGEGMAFDETGQESLAEQLHHRVSVPRLERVKRTIVREMPSVTSMCPCGCHCKRSPLVAIETTMPGRVPGPVPALPELRRRHPRGRPQDPHLRHRGGAPLGLACPPRQHRLPREARRALRRQDRAVRGRSRGGQAAHASVPRAIRDPGEGVAAGRTRRGYGGMQALEAGDPHSSRLQGADRGAFQALTRGTSPTAAGPKCATRTSRFSPGNSSK